MIIDCDSSKLIESVEDSYISQFCIYGYDTEKGVFYSPEINRCRWSAVEYSMNDLKEAFHVRKLIDNKNLEKNIFLRQCIQPITRIEVRKDFNEIPNLNIFYNQLKRHRFCRQYEIIPDADVNNECALPFREGICSVYIGFIEQLEKIINNEFDLAKMFHGLPYNFKKLREFNSMLKWRLQVLESYYKLNLDYEIYSDIDKTVGELEMCTNLAIKYSENRDNGIIKTIHKVVKDIFDTKEKLINVLIKKAEECLLYR